MRGVRANAKVGASASAENISSLISRFANDTTVVGIDVSYHQANIDWKAVANSGVKFAIIRCGYRGYTQGTIIKDEKFTKNMQEAINNGIYVGVYFYSTAINEQEAIQEAAAAVEWVKNYDLSYPIAYDFEEFENKGRRTDNLSKEQINKNAKAFLGYVKSKGYKATLYGSSSYLKNTWNMSDFSNYDTWVAHYYVTKPSYQGDYQMWQYTDKGVVPGISGEVDVDVDYNYWIGMKTTVSIMSHIQDIGWEKNWKYEGQMSGTSGQAKRLEAIKVKLNNTVYKGNVLYKTHIQDFGWEKEYKRNGEISGTSGQSKRLEAMQIKLEGEIADKFDIYYRVHIQDYGWLGWAKNGESAGTEGLAKRMESVQVKLVTKGGKAPGSTANKFIKLSDVKYRAHVQDYGWQNYVYNGAMSGTSGQSKRVEAMNISLINYNVSGGIQYRCHIQDIGWENSFKKDGEMSGTSGQSKRLEAMQIRLYGDVANQFDVYYRVHIQDYGWLGWAKNGEYAGSEGLSKRMESYEIRIVPKGSAAPGTSGNAFVK